jgi:nitrate reductase beta subunit
MNATTIVANNSNNTLNVSPAAATENPKQPQQKQTAQQLVRENVQYLIEQLEAGHREALTGFLRAMAVFRTYSLSNQLAIARQRPTASRVAGSSAARSLRSASSKRPFGIGHLPKC